MTFEWDEEKAEENLRKHGISFAEASGVFDDPEAVEERDDGDFGAETRLWSVGVVEGLELFVSFTIGGKIVRIISARKANRHEREGYWENRYLHT